MKTYKYKVIERGFGVPIDKQLLPILSELNSRGYKTHDSCAGHRKKEMKEAKIEAFMQGKSKPQYLDMDGTIASEPRGYLGITKIRGRNIAMPPHGTYIRKIEREEILSIMKKYGLKNVKYIRPGIFSFSAMP